MADWLTQTLKTSSLNVAGTKTSPANDWLDSAAKASGAYRPNQLVSDIKAPQTTQQKSPTVPQATQSQPQSFLQGAGKFIARTGVALADVASEAVDFTTSFISNNIDLITRTPQTRITQKLTGVDLQAGSKKAANKWKEFYNQKLKEDKVPTRELKEAVDQLQKIEYIQPSKEWNEAPLKVKLTTKLPETILNIGPSLISSIGIYAINPLLGAGVTVASTANDVKEQAIENSVDPDKAEKLGLVSGILVGALDRIVPDELFSGANKGRFLSSFVKRVATTSLKEAGTEIAQEDIQILAEATFRQDLGWDEIKTRNVMAGLGGLLGGAGAEIVVSTVNNTFNEVLTETDTEVAPQEEGAQVVTPDQAIAIALDEDIKPEQSQAIVKVAAEAKQTDQNIQIDVDEKGNVIAELVPVERRIEAPQERLSLPEGQEQPSSKFIYNQQTESTTIQTGEEILGEDFVMTPKADKNKVEVGKKLAEYRYALERYNKNPTVNTLKRLRKAKAVVEELRKNNFVIEETKPKVVRKARTIKPAKVSPVVKPVATETKTEVATEATKVKPKEVEVSREQLPVGEGKKKLSRLEARITESLDKAPEEVKDLSTFNQMNKADQKARAAKYVTENQDEAMAVMRGEKQAPKGLLTNSVFVALYNKAAGDPVLARALSTMRSTRFGQEISILTEIDPDNPVKLMREIVQIREEAFKKRFRNKTVKQAKAQVTKNIQAEIKAPTKSEWSNFLDSIEC